MDAWRRIDRAFVDAKDSAGALPALFALYRRLSTTERKEVDVCLIHALASGTESERFDALAIINEFRIAAALPALRELAVRLQLEDSPGAPFELAKVNRFISKLAMPA